MPEERSAALDENGANVNRCVPEVVKAVDGIIGPLNPRNDTLPY